MRIDNGQGPGNGYRTQSLYGPALELTIGANDPIPSTAGTEDFRLTFTQQQNLYPMLQFQARLLIESSTLEDLSVDQMVGTIQGHSVNANLFVKEVEPGRVVLDILFDLESSSEGTLTLEIQERDGFQMLGLDYQRDFFSETISLLLFPSNLEVILAGLPVTFPAAGNLVFATAKTTSGVTAADGLDSVLTTFTVDGFLRGAQP